MVARRTVDLRIEFSSWQYIFIFFLVHGLPALVDARYLSFVIN